jgi:MFS family permease
MSVGLAPAFMGTFPLFLEPVSTEFGWARSIFPQAVIIPAIVGAVWGPFAGRAIDRFGVRVMAAPGIVLFAASLFMLSIMHGSLIELYVIGTIMGLGGPLAGPIAFVKVISSWFDRRRGLVLGLVLSAAPMLTIAALTPALGAMLPHVGWREGYRLVSVGVLVLGLIAVLLMKERQVSAGESLGAAGTSRPTIQLTGVTPREALGSRNFWIILACTCFTAAAVSGVNSHIIAWCTTQHIPLESARWLLSASSLAGIGGPVVAGLIVDRFQTPRVMVVFHLAALVGLLLLLSTRSAVVMVTGMSMMGFGYSAVTGLTPFLTSRYFGLRSASEIFGIAIGAATMAIGAGPVLMGVGFDHFGSYHVPLWTAVVVIATASIAVLFLGEYVYSGRREQGHPQLQSP